MSSPPTRPVRIGSPVQLGSPVRPLRNIDDDDVTGTPDTRQPRQHYGTPPAGTTIPRFRGTPGSSTPVAVGSPARLPPPAELFRNSPRTVGSPLDRGLLRVVSATDVAKTQSPAPPELSGEDKAKVLRRHLVSRDQRFGDEPPGSQGPSRTPSFYPEASEHPSTKSSRTPSVHHREDESEVFPLPYSAPGGDIT
jgi:solute carrier family 36 (proton-coupled amino acid transporter)